MLGMIISYTLIYGDYVINPSISGFTRSMSTPFLPAMDAMDGFFYIHPPDQLQRLICLDVFLLDDQPTKRVVNGWLTSNANCKFQREQLGTLGRVPEIYTNIWII